MIYLNDNETATDFLYYEAISKTVVELIQRTGDSPVSIGVHGDWGAGKSSILAMIEEQFLPNENVVCIRFNGWQFQGFEDAKTVLIEQILESLEESKPILRKGRDKIAGLFKRVRWFKLARKAGGLAIGAATGMPVEVIGQMIFDQVKSKIAAPEEGIKALEEVGGYFKESENKNIPAEMSAFKKEFEELLKDAGIERLVVLIDDLDRCLPTTAIETLEAIKLFLFVPRATFVIAADEAMIEYAVKQHFPDLPLGAGSLTYSRNYLEKLIQVPFRIPAMGLAETRVYIALLALEAATGSVSEEFKKLRASAREVLRKPWKADAFDRSRLTELFGGKLSQEVEAALTMSDQLSEQLTEGTKGNPRQVKRFLNAMLLREAIAAARGMEGEITKPALAKILIAERFHEGFFEELCQLVALSSDGKVELVSELESVKAKQAKPEKKGQQNDWLSNEAIIKWAALEPKLGEEDLRPYILITRDKRSIFGSGAALKFESLLIKLLGTSRAVVISAGSEVKALSREDSNFVFEELRAKIKRRDDFLNLPPGAIGIAELVKQHPHLEETLLSFAEEIPASKLGSWVFGDGAWASSLKQTAVVAKWNALVEKWAKEGSNELAKAARAMSPSKAKRN